MHCISLTGGVDDRVSVQVRLQRMRRHAAVPAEAAARGHMRVAALLVPVSRGQLQVAGVVGRRHAPPHDRPQVNHKPAGILIFLNNC